MAEELEAVLRLVADGTLTPEQAAPIIDALSRAESPAGDRLHRRIDRGLDRVRDRVEQAYARAEQARATVEGRGTLQGRQLRIRVTEHGRQVVNLRIPIGLVDAALGFVPGIGGDQSERIRQAVAAGTVGPIIDVEDTDGDSVLISVE
jgi:hypothetical protein